MWVMPGMLIWAMASPLVYICDHVFDRVRPISFLAHHADGMWQLTCGERDHSIGGASIKPVHLEHIATADLAAAMLQTPPSHLSVLGEDGRWVVEPFNEEDGEE